MIPRRIHYCWFGGAPMPELAQRCIASWKKYCPDYEIVRWDESNFDLDSYAYVREAYQAKRWAFVTDVVRLYALVNYGGIYMDTDVEVLKPLDELLGYKAVSGFETIDWISTGLMACEKGHPLFRELLSEYENAHFARSDGSYDITTNVTRITNTCLRYGLVLNNHKQTVQDFTLLPCEYLCPKNSETGELHVTDNTITIHHFDGSWITPEQRYAQALRKRMIRFLPKTAAGYMAAFAAVSRYRGFIGAIQYTLAWARRKRKKVQK